MAELLDFDDMDSYIMPSVVMHAFTGFEETVTLRTESRTPPTPKGKSGLGLAERSVNISRRLGSKPTTQRIGKTQPYSHDEDESSLFLSSSNLSVSMPSIVQSDFLALSEEGTPVTCVPHSKKSTNKVELGVHQEGNAHVTPIDQLQSLVERTAETQHVRDSEQKQNSSSNRSLWIEGKPPMRSSATVNLERKSVSLRLSNQRSSSTAGTNANTLSAQTCEKSAVSSRRSSSSKKTVPPVVESPRNIPAKKMGKSRVSGSLESSLTCSNDVVTTTTTTTSSHKSASRISSRSGQSTSLQGRMSPTRLAASLSNTIPGTDAAVAAGKAVNAGLRTSRVASSTPSALKRTPSEMSPRNSGSEPSSIAGMRHRRPSSSASSTLMEECESLKNRIYELESDNTMLREALEARKTRVAVFTGLEEELRLRMENICIDLEIAPLHVPRGSSVVYGASLVTHVVMETLRTITPRALAAFLRGKTLVTVSYLQKCEAVGVLVHPGPEETLRLENTPIPPHRVFFCGKTPTDDVRAALQEVLIIADSMNEADITCASAYELVQKLKNFDLEETIRRSKPSEKRPLPS